MANVDAGPTTPRLSMADFDPFKDVLRPPTNETELQREAREQAELEAKRVSEGIDAMIQKEKQEMNNWRARGRCVRVLLLGQSESGKSTLQRQFTLMHAPEAFDAERTAWRLVVFLNVVRSVQRILKILELSLERDPDDEDEDPTSPYYSPSRNRTSRQQLQPPRVPSLSPTLPSLPALPAGPSGRPKSAKSASSYVAEMKLRLSPITSLEETIINKLVGPEERNIQLSAIHSKTRIQGLSGLTGVLEGMDREFFVRPDNSWNKNGGSKNGAFMNKIRRAVQVKSGSNGGKSSPSNNNKHGRKSVDGRPSMESNSSDTAFSTSDWDDKNDPGRFFHMCGQDLIGLWNDPWVRNRLAKFSIRLEEGSGFFLDDLDRITGPRYMPTDDDILRARIKTIGVSEHIFPVDKSGVEWRLYDVGGARTQRHAWVPYFDNVDCIIFLAPLSPFDQCLPEDRKVNCLEDSLHIWKELCSNKLLENVPLVLFLNKSDLLRKKLQDGVKVSRFVVSYGNRPNDYESVEKYFLSKFEAIRKHHFDKQRPVFTHVTSCINQVTTARIIANVQNILMRENLRNNSLVVS